MKWLIVKNGKDWEAKLRTNQKHRPRGAESKLVPGVDTIWPKVIDVDGKLSVIENEFKKQEYLYNQTVEADHKAEMVKYKKALMQLDDDIDNASEIVALKVILKKIIKVFPHLLRDIN